ncbi:MAG: phosphate ABC transporter substrate-binding protein [Anaerolineae bacterium]|nr:phosphate ABC transporter substrate-binding protein [Anaerolineae bacterium]
MSASLLAQTWFLVVLCLISGACAPSPSPTPTPTPTPARAWEIVTVSGASSMAPLLAALAEAFQDEHPDIAVDIEAVNTAFGLERVRQGQADLAAVALEPPADLWRAPIALDGVALIVHADNPLESLTETQAQILFSGRLWHWSDFDVTVAEDEITVVSREQGSGDRAVFEARLMKELPVAPTAVLLPGAQDVVEFVAAHPGAIGYVSQGSISPEVKAVTLESIAPVPQTIAAQTYPLARPFYLVALEEPGGSARAFLDFCLSQPGQAIVGQNYVPVRE